MKRVSKRSGGTPELREEREDGCPSFSLLSRSPLKGRIKDSSELAATQSERWDREWWWWWWSGFKVELIGRRRRRLFKKNKVQDGARRNVG